MPHRKRRMEDQGLSRERVISAQIINRDATMDGAKEPGFEGLGAFKTCFRPAGRRMDNIIYSWWAALDLRLVWSRPGQREAEQSVNFVTCHDGFTLNDSFPSTTSTTRRTAKGTAMGRTITAAGIVVPRAPPPTPRSSRYDGLRSRIS